MAARKRRTRSPHPGVKLTRRTLGNGHSFWRARFIDPDTNKIVDLTLDGKTLTSDEARTDWAKKKSKAIARRRMEIELGAVKRPNIALETGVEDYLKRCDRELRPATVAKYRSLCEQFKKWAAGAGIVTLDDLGRGKLFAFRETLIQSKKHNPDGKSGAKRSPHYINSDIAAAKAMVNYWRTRESLVHLTRDDILDAFKPVRADRKDPAFLRPHQCRELIEAALRHDQKTFEETREEHSGRRPRGTTTRYQAIAPFLLYVLLSGCRREEALALRWFYVDLDALDHDGRKVGEVNLPASATKTRRPRTIDLDVSPGLRRLLAALKLRAGGTEYVFGGKKALSGYLADSTRKRLFKEFGAPRFSWQQLRATAGTYLTNAPGIFGAASVYRSAAQLGHSVAVAEKHYLGVFRGIARDVRTLEAAMQFTDLVEQAIDEVSSGGTVFDTAAAR